MTESTYHILLLRHGESVGNERGLLQGQADFPLSNTGRLQALALADRWRGTDLAFDLIVSSPLSRARQTAEVLANALQLPVEMDPVWMERDYGAWAGRKLTDYTSRDLAGPPNPFVRPGETGESNFDLHLRAGRAVRGLMDREPGRYLVVSHGGLLNMVLFAILGIPPQPGFSGPRFNFRNCGFATLTYTPNLHRWRVLGIDDQSHWSNSMERPEPPPGTRNVAS